MQKRRGVGGEKREERREGFTDWRGLRDRPGRSMLVIDDISFSFLLPTFLSLSLSLSSMASDKRKFHENEESRVDERGSIKKRVIGPALPQNRNSLDNDNDNDDRNSNSNSSSHSDDDSDDDFGPSLPPPQGVFTPLDKPEQQQQQQQQPASEARSEKETRDQWMLQPPAHGDWASKVDPTQLRNRKFQGKATGSTSKQLDASWVESPEDRLKRLGDAVMGVAPSGDTGPSKSTSEGATKAALMEEKIRKFNVSHISQNHGAILIACAQDRTKKNTRLESQNHTRKDEDDDPSSRAFDREKDMAISSKISNAQRREMVDKAGGYSSRFKKGNFL